MNCVKCGHNKDAHKVFSDGLASCIHDPGEGFPLCGCSRTPKGIERDLIDAELAAWKAEALAAREVLATMKGRVMFRHPTVEEETDKLYKKYLAAKVVDIPMFPQ